MTIKLQEDVTFESPTKIFSSLVNTYMPRFWARFLPPGDHRIQEESQYEKRSPSNTVSVTRAAVDPMNTHEDHIVKFNLEWRVHNTNMPSPNSPAMSDSEHLETGIVFDTGERGKWPRFGDDNLGTKGSIVHGSNT